MYLGIYLQKNNKTNKQKNRTKQNKREKKSKNERKKKGAEQGLNLAPSARCHFT